jgi:hypothetical protein
LDLAREQDQASAERVARRHDTVHAREGIEAAEIDGGVVGKALHGCRDVPKLHVLGDEESIPLDGSAQRQARLERANSREQFPETWNHVAVGDDAIGQCPGKDQSMVRRAKLHLDARQVHGAIERRDGDEAPSRSVHLVRLKRVGHRDQPGHQPDQTQQSHGEPPVAAHHRISAVGAVR